MDSEVIATSPSEAKNLGLSKYFTGKPCKYGHIDFRLASSSNCLTCYHEWRASNQEAIKKSVSKYHETNKDKIYTRKKLHYELTRDVRLEKAKIYRDANKLKVSAVQSKWIEENRGKKNELTARRKIAKVRATPSWADLELVQQFYIEANRRTRETGVIHQSDHIVPINSPLVCGLHNQFNLQVLTRKENLEKGNRVWPDMSPWTPELRQLVKNFKEQK
jgi:hypothetical protein